MNILIFTAIYPAPAEYGIPNDTKVVHYYAKQWEKAGHKVQVVYLHMIPVKQIVHFTNFKKCFGCESDYEIEGIKVHLLEYQILEPRVNYLRAFQAKDADRRIARFVGETFEPDRVFVHFPCSFKGMKRLATFDCPTMAVLHNSDINILKKDVKISSEINRYQHIGGRNYNICNVANEMLLRKTSLVLSGIDDVLIPSSEWIDQKLIRPSKHIKMVYAGNLIKLKRVDSIIKALQQVNFEYRLDIIGDGPEKQNLMALAKDNPKINFVGRMRREETIQKMRDADVFVMVSSPETFGLVYLEAMAQGCIVIGSKNEGIDGVIVDGENGFLVEPYKVEELVKCMEKISAMEPEKKKNLVHSAYCCASDMTDFSMANKYLNLNR